MKNVKHVSAQLQDLYLHVLGSIRRAQFSLDRLDTSNRSPDLEDWSAIYCECCQQFIRLSFAQADELAELAELDTELQPGAPAELEEKGGAQ